MNMQVTPPIDPRMRRRRIEVIRQEGRRRLRIIVAAGSISALVAAGWASTRSPLLDVDRVDVIGATATPPADVVAASGVRRGLPLVDLDEAAARRGVVDLPWVRTASVVRRWPSTVTITVVERIAVAAAPAAGSQWALVDSNGQVVAWTGSPRGLPALSGIDPAGPPGSALGATAAGALRVAAAVPDELRSRLEAVAAGEGGAVELKLQQGGRVRLGVPDHLAEKFRSVLSVLAQVDTQGLSTLDVRIPQSPVLTRLNPVGTVSTLGAG
jgi:cell division protein FtsQ